MIPWLDPDAAPHFPPVQSALRDPDGLLAAGGALTPDWLLAAYRRGIFPWYLPGEPVLWWSPDPRMIVVPGQMRLTRSLLRTLRRAPFEIRCNTAFAEVMEACAAPRRDLPAGTPTGAHTWISSEIRAAYCRMHALGWAHSIEAWQGGALVGGLYGIAIGRVFYGESMFHRVTDASKLAFAHLASVLERRNFAVIDCQMTTAHLRSLGGFEIEREAFVRDVGRWTGEVALPGTWDSAALQVDWSRVALARGD